MLKRPPHPEVLHPIQVVTRRTGVSADVLRVWEKRYAVVTPVRSASGRRLYSDADIERLRLMVQTTRTGRTIGQVAALPTAALVVHTPLTVNHRADIARIALQKRIAMVGAPVQFAEAGALVSYGPDLPQYFRQAATLVDKILKGAKPQDMPIEQATKFEFVINMRTARALGVSIPSSILVRADRVID